MTETKKEEPFFVKHFRPIMGFSVFVIGSIFLFFEQTKSIGPFMIGFGLSYGLMSLRS